jgi:hypothetical protein
MQGSVGKRKASLNAIIPGTDPFTGSNPLSGLLPGRNQDLMQLKDLWSDRPDFGPRWLHSDLKNVAYRYNHKLYEYLNTTGGLNAAQ